MGLIDARQERAGRRGGGVTCAWHPHQLANTAQDHVVLTAKTVISAVAGCDVFLTVSRLLSSVTAPPLAPLSVSIRAAGSHSSDPIRCQHDLFTLSRFTLPHNVSPCGAALTHITHPPCNVPSPMQCASPSHCRTRGQTPHRVPVSVPQSSY